MSVQDPTYSRVIMDRESAEHVLAERIALGQDRLDEVWDGEYHMVSMPTSEHDRIDTELLLFLASLVKRHDLGRIGCVNVGRPGQKDRDFRIPDRVFIAKARIAEILVEWGCVGGPDLALEIRSPGDETYKKIPFYGKIGVRELLVIHRDTKKVELFRNVGGDLQPTVVGAEGWYRLETLPVEPRTITKSDGSPGVEARDVRDPSLAAVI